MQDITVLLVDDNAELLELLQQGLRAAGYTNIAAAATCAGARRQFAEKQPQLMILDINLPDGDGFSLLKEFRAAADIPALFLSARDADEDRLTGLGLGADDYLTKPFLMQELVLRVKQILRRSYKTDLQRAGGSLRVGGRTVSMADAVVHLPGGGELQLTATERTILQALADNRGHIVTTDTLCAAVWGHGNYGYDNTLNVHIRHLREKLEGKPGKPQYLLTVRGLGYKLLEDEQ